MPFCIKCGKKLPEDARFCSGCGAPVAVDEAEPEKPVNVEPAKASAAPAAKTSAQRVGEKIEFSGTFSISDDTIFKDVTFIAPARSDDYVYGGEEVDDCENVVISGSATPQFINCSFENCGLVASDSSYPLLENCKIKEPVFGIFVKDAAGVKCTGCSIIEPAEEGITIHHDEQEPAKQSLFNDVKISAGVTIVGSYAKPQFTACEAFESDLGFNICKDSAAVLEQCKTHDCFSGFGIFGKGCTLIDCEAYQIDALGFSIAGASATVFERCKAHDCFSGFGVGNKCSLTFRNCEAYGNNQKGFEVESGCECTFTDCKSNGKAFTKTTGLMGLKI